MQRLASSRSPTKYASAASCRVNMAHAWKCRSYVPTSRAILWTSCEMGIFQIRSSVLIWKQQILQRATVPSQYFMGLFTFPAFRNSFLGALPPTVGQNFLLAGSSPPEMDGLTSTAIWSHCQVGDDSGDLPASLRLSTSSTHCASSSWVEACSISRAGAPPVVGFPCLLLHSTLILTCRALLPSPICGVFFVLAMQEARQRERVSPSEARAVLQELCGSHFEF